MRSKYGGWCAACTSPGASQRAELEREANGKPSLADPPPQVNYTRHTIKSIPPWAGRPRDVFGTQPTSDLDTQCVLLACMPL